MLKYLRMDVLWSWILDFFPLSLVIHNHKDFFLTNDTAVVAARPQNVELGLWPEAQPIFSLN
jgi:hypothetical protein